MDKNHYLTIYVTNAHNTAIKARYEY